MCDRLRPSLQCGPFHSRSWCAPPTDASIRPLAARNRISTCARAPASWVLAHVQPAAAKNPLSGEPSDDLCRRGLVVHDGRLHGVLQQGEPHVVSLVISRGCDGQSPQSLGRSRRTRNHEERPVQRVPLHSEDEKRIARREHRLELRVTDQLHSGNEVHVIQTSRLRRRAMHVRMSLG